MDLSLKPFPVGAHGSWVGAIPFFAFVVVAVGLQYFQMAQINNRNRKTGQADAEPAAWRCSGSYRLFSHTSTSSSLLLSSST